MKPVDLEESREFFASEEAYQEFVGLVQDAANNGMVPIMDNGDLIGSIVSTDVAKTILEDRIERKTDG